MPGPTRGERAQTTMKEAFGSAELKAMEERLLEAIVKSKSELKTEIEGVREEVKMARKDFQRELQELHERVEKDLDEVKSALQTEIAELRAEAERVEYHQRKYNLLFYGVKTKKGEEEKALIAMLKDKLNIDLGKEDFVNVHAVGEKGIIARFQRWEDRQQVLSSTKKLQGTEIGVRTDLPARLQAKRAHLLSRRKDLKKEGKIVRVVERNRDVLLQVKPTADGVWETVE